MLTEQQFQKKVIERIEKEWPTAIVLKNDPTYLQGFLDLIIFFDDRWAALEVKKTRNSRRQPNQKYWVNITNQMSFGAFVFPENLEEIIRELQRIFNLCR